MSRMRKGLKIMADKQLQAVDVLAFGPHPDDVEIGAAASIAKDAAGGHRVFICDLTAGEMGTNGNVATRAREGRMAAEVLGAVGRACLGLPDGRLGAAADGADLVAGMIRALRPQVVLGPWHEERHPDHRDGYEMVRRGLFLAGLNRYEIDRPQRLPEGLGDGALIPHRVPVVFYYLINSPARPDILVDVSAHYQAKRRALAAFDSQFGYRAAAMPTPLNDGIYLPGVEGRDASFGRDAGVSFAEGFIAERCPCIPSLLDVEVCR